jgi:hypothetical protein
LKNPVGGQPEHTPPVSLMQYRAPPFVATRISKSQSLLKSATIGEVSNDVPVYTVQIFVLVAISIAVMYPSEAVTIIVS